MAACELGSKVAGQLEHLAQAPHLGVLLGAGASVAAGLPNWDELALRLLRQAGAISDLETARAYLARQDPALAAEAARAVSTDWYAVVHEALYGDAAADVPPSSLHLAAANLATTGRRTVSLFTLNLDDLLEQALRDVLSDLERPEGVTSRTAAAPRAPAGDREVQHLHGLLPRALPAAGQDLVLTLSDFNALTAAAQPWQAGALSESLSRGPLVLAGTTYRDSDVRQWLHSIGEQLPGRESVVALIAREGLAVSREQFRAVSGAVAQQWSAIGASALLLQDHADAAQLLRELPAVGEPHYRLPQQRAAACFDSHREAFQERQTDYAQALDADLDDLPTGPHASSDLTLWLADGSSELVRWASHDRTYREPAKLRRVPLGHDSPWTAARAVALNEVLVDGPNDAHRPDRRWRTVLAAPVTVSLPGGPDLVVGAISAGTTAVVDDDEEELHWRTAMADLAEDWSDRIAASTSSDHP